MEPRSEEDLQKHAREVAACMMNALAAEGIVDPKRIENWKAVADRLVECSVQMHRDALL